MATIIGTGGSWASAWVVCDPTAESDSQAANTALTTSYVAGSTFTPGAIVIDAIPVKVASRAAAPGANTISVALDQGGSTVTGTEITVNCVDIDANGGWHIFKLASPVTLVTATAYSVKAKTSAGSMVNLYSTATTNWSRQLRTTTTQAGPAAGDKMIVAKEMTGVGAANFVNQLVDGDYSATSTGSVSFSQSLHIASGGAVAFTTSASTAAKLKLKGIASVMPGGIFAMGNSTADPVPASSSAELIFDVATNVDSGLEVSTGSSGLSISGVTAANPGVVTLALALNFQSGVELTISGGTGTWAAVNRYWFWTRLSASTGTLKDENGIELDTSTFGAVTGTLVFAYGGTRKGFGYAKKSTQLKLSKDFGGYARSDGAGTWVYLLQGGGNNTVAGYPAGLWDTGAGFGNGDSITFTAVGAVGTTYPKTLAASSAVRNWAAVSIASTSVGASTTFTEFCFK